MAVPCVGAVGGRDGGQPVTGGTGGNARAAARRAPQVQRRSCQPSCVRVPRALRARPVERDHVTSPARARCLTRDHAPFGARRAPRALDGFVKKVLTVAGGTGPPPGNSRLRHAPPAGRKLASVKTTRRIEVADGASRAADAEVVGVPGRESLPLWSGALVDAPLLAGVRPELWPAGR